MSGLFLMLVGNRFAQLGLAFVIGFGWGWHRTDTSWRMYVAEERGAAEAALKIERARQESAAREIAAEATRRLEEEQDAVAEMLRQIDDLKRSETNAPNKECRACVVDDEFARRMRDLDAAGRKARAPRRAR